MLAMQDKLTSLSQSVLSCSQLEDFQTPFYFYNLNNAIDQIKSIRDLAGQRVQIYYALKANPSIPIVQELSQHVDGIDIASGGEAKRVLEAGSSLAGVSFAGPGKSDKELEFVIESNIGLISVESLTELIRIECIAGRLDINQDILVRVNPDSPVPKYGLKMGGIPSPFGIDNDQLGEFFSELTHCKNLNFRGIHVYSGTQCLDPSSLVSNFKEVFKIANQVEKIFRREVSVINFGGGFGIPYYEEDESLDIKMPIEYLMEELDNWGKKRNRQRPVSAILELGRFIVGESGVYVAKIVDKKVSKRTTFCILDGGLNHNLAATGNFGQVIRRPYRVRNLSKEGLGKGSERVDLVGPLCTSIDRFGSVELSDPQVGDLVGVFSSGAYGYSASPRDFLGHPGPAEYIYKGNQLLAGDWPTPG